MMLARRNVPRRWAALIAALALVLPGWLLAQAPGKAELLWLGQAAWKTTTPVAM